MKNPSVDPEVKYLYLRDPWCEQRVLTIGRKFIDGDLYFAWAINKVERSKVAHECHGYRPQWVVYDRFDKKVARHIVNQRLALEHTRQRAFPMEGEKAIPAILRCIDTLCETLDAMQVKLCVPKRVGNLVRRALDPHKYPNPYPPKGEPTHFRKDQVTLPAKLIGEQFTVTSTAVPQEA